MGITSFILKNGLIALVMLKDNDMKKLFESLKKIKEWVATDGLLHFLVCYALMVALTPIIGWWALLVTILSALGKEGYDYFVEKDNNKEQVIHDLICDVVGMGCALVVVLVWWIAYL